MIISELLIQFTDKCDDEGEGVMVDAHYLQAYQLETIPQSFQ